MTIDVASLKNLIKDYLKEHITLKTKNNYSYEDGALESVDVTICVDEEEIDTVTVEML